METVTSESTPQATTETLITPDTTSQTSFGYTDFINQYTPEQRQVYEKQGIKDFDTLHKSYQGLLSKIGEKGLIPPKETASEQEKADFTKQLYKHIGVPENGTYEYAVAEDVNADLINDDFVSNLAKIAYDNGVPSKAFENIINQVYREFVPEYQALTQEIEQLKARLGQEGKMDIKTEPAPTQDYESLIDSKRREFLIADREGRVSDKERLKSEYHDLINKQISLQKK